jgi:hypothetical protein
MDAYTFSWSAAEDLLRRLVIPKIRKVVVVVQEVVSIFLIQVVLKCIPRS